MILIILILLLLLPYYYSVARSLNLVTHIPGPSTTVTVFVFFTVNVKSYFCSIDEYCSDIFCFLVVLFGDTLFNSTIIK